MDAVMISDLQLQRNALDELEFEPSVMARIPLGLDGRACRN
jgi:hypothetical protein